MRVNRDRFILLAGAIAACHEAREDRSAVTIAALPPPPPRVVDICGALLHDNEQALATPRHTTPTDAAAPTCPHEFADKSRDLLRNAAERPPFLTYCHPSAGGTWAVVVVSASLDDPGGEGPPCGWAASYKLIHVRSGEKRDSAISSEAIDYLAWTNETNEWKVEGVFDYDEDGQDEIILSKHVWENGGGSDGTPSLTIFKATPTQITPYPTHASSRLMSLVDVDNDGRPDFTTGFFSVDCPGGIAGSYREYGVPLLLHSLPRGDFSETDEAARRFAITQCPSMPAAAKDFTSASCQRLWGRPLAAIGKDLARGDEPSCAEDARKALAEPLPFKTLDVDTPRPFHFIQPTK